MGNMNMAEVALPYEKGFVCLICGHVSPIREQIERHNDRRIAEDASLKVGDRVRIDDMLWADNWYEPRLPSEGTWTVMRLFYAPPALSSRFELHELLITVERKVSAATTIMRTVPYAHFDKMWVRGPVAPAVFGEGGSVPGGQEAAR